MSYHYRDWCEERGCTHAHCPEDCEHPQPFISADGVLFCGQCYVKRRVFSEMVPCGDSVMTHSAMLHIRLPRTLIKRIDHLTVERLLLRVIDAAEAEARAADAVEP